MITRDTVRDFLEAIERGRCIVVWGEKKDRLEIDGEPAPFGLKSQLILGRVWQKDDVLHLTPKGQAVLDRLRREDFEGLWG